VPGGAIAGGRASQPAREPVRARLARCSPLRESPVIRTAGLCEQQQGRCVSASG
jgi:hypothetical protein